MSPRAYESPLRASQAERTRQVILEAMVAELSLGGEELSIPRVAERAGVSVRTVYHHFPNREAQIEALAQHVEQTLGPDKEPMSAAELPAYLARRHRTFCEHEQLCRAQLSPGLASHVRERRRKRRTSAIEKCVREVCADEAQARLGAAMLKHLIGATTAVALMDRSGLTHEEVGRVSSWAVQVLVDALARGLGPPPSTVPASHEK